MNKIWLRNEPIYDTGELLESNPVERTEEDIIKYYWPYWQEVMIKKYGEGHELITKENCIEDWVVVNWAWEKKEDE